MTSYIEEAKHYYAQARMSANDYQREIAQSYAVMAQAAATLAMMEDLHQLRALIQKGEEALHQS